MGSIVLSLSPEEALGYLARIHSILIIHTPPPEIILPQRIYIHSLGFPDDPELKRGCHEILAEFGFTSETFPAFAIQGYATIAELIKYEPQKFDQDREAHGHSESLSAYQTRLNISSPIMGLRFINTYFFEAPILDVLPTSVIYSGSFWQMKL
jgi:hypothetical protein